MESLLSSDDSSDQDYRNLRNQLSEFGLEEESLSKEEMVDLLKALKNSKATNVQEELFQKKVEDHIEKSSSSKVTMKRRYLNVRDRRMPWSIIPQTLGAAEKAKALAVYIKLMSINNYRQARQSVNMAVWPPPIQIIESSRIQSHRSTRSGRSVPVYTDYDEDSSDFDSVVTKTKKRRVFNIDQNDICSKKSLTLKRKLSKDENIRPIKEARVRREILKCDAENISADMYTIVED